MKNITQTIKQSSFSIFTIVILALTVAVVVWFNHIVTTGMTINPSAGSSTNSGQQENTQSQTFNADTANRLRELTPAANVTTAPELNVEGRINPFAE